MKLRRLLLFFFISFTIGTVSFGQDDIADYKKQLKNNNLSDFEYAEIYTGLSGSDADDSIQKWANLALKHIKILENKKSIKPKLRDEIYFLKAQIFSNIGYGLKVKGYLKEALNSYFTGITFAEKCKNKEPLGNLRNNLGSVYLMQEEYEQAIKNYMISVSIFKNNSENASFLGRTYFNLASCYDGLKNAKQCIHYYKLASYEFETVKDTIYLAYSWTNMASRYHKAHKLDSSESYALKAMAVFDKLKLKEEQAWSRSILANIKISTGEFPEAKIYCDECLKLGLETRAPVQIQSCYEAINRYYTAMGDYKLAYTYFRKFDSIKDLLTNNDNKIALSTGEIQYEFTKKAEEMRMENAKRKVRFQEEKKRGNLILYFSIGMSLLIAGIAYSVFRNLKKQRLANTIISNQHEIIQNFNKDLIDSINYAERIQKVLMKGEKILDQEFGDNFIYYAPKAIVSGDFYLSDFLPDNRIAIMVADSTGHGVPGAFMSLLNISFLNEAIHVQKLPSAHEIFEFIKSKLIHNLRHHDGTFGQDGMDAVLFLFNPLTKELSFAAANNAPIIIRNNEIIEYNSDKIAIGYSSDESLRFTSQNVQLESNDIVIAWTDGYADQFGGEHNKKFKKKELIHLIHQNIHLPLPALGKILEETFVAWKGDHEQIDDVLIVGFKVK